MTARTAEMFEKPPRARPRVMMHWDDAGYTTGPIGDFHCVRCGHRAGWLLATEEEVRRGIPCPNCNCLVEPVGGQVGDHPRCAQYPECPCGGPLPQPREQT